MSATNGSQRVRGFYQASRSWYYKSTHKDGGEDFNIGVYHVRPENGCSFEFAIRWHAIKAWRLEVFDDSWAGLAAEFGDVLKELGKLPKDASAEHIRSVLVRLGIEDLTNENPPDHVAAQELRTRQEQERNDLETRQSDEARKLLHPAYRGSR